MEVPMWMVFVLLVTHLICLMIGYGMGKPDKPKEDETCQAKPQGPPSG